MIYSVGCEYGIRALAKLACLAPTGHFCLMREILDGDELPPHFVGKIFQILVREELLLSAKGRGGGFALRKPPEEIMLRAIVDAIDGPHQEKFCLLGLTDCDERRTPQIHCRCAEMRAQIDELLDTTSLADLVALLEPRARSKQVVRH